MWCWTALSPSWSPHHHVTTAKLPSWEGSKGHRWKHTKEVPEFFGSRVQDRIFLITYPENRVGNFHCKMLRAKSTPWHCISLPLPPPLFLPTLFTPIHPKHWGNFLLEPSNWPSAPWVPRAARMLFSGVAGTPGPWAADSAQWFTKIWKVTSRMSAPHTEHCVPHSIIPRGLFPFFPSWLLYMRWHKTHNLTNTRYSLTPGQPSRWDGVLKDLLLKKKKKSITLF